MNNLQIAQALEDLSNAISLKGAVGSDKFKIKHYREAALVIKNYPSEIAKLSKEELMAIKGIGNSISDKILEMVTSGKIDKLEEIKKDIPPITINEFTKLKGIGPAGAKKLWLQTGVKSMVELIALADAGKLDQKLVDKINFYKVAAERILLYQALAISDQIVQAIRPYCNKISYAGSVRRKCDTVHDVDIIVNSDNFEKVKEIFKSFADTVESEGEYKVAIYRQNTKVEIAFIKKDAWGGARFHFTGSKEYNIKNRQIAISKGWMLNDKGLWDSDGKQLDDGCEESICNLLEVSFLDPELRELMIDVKTVQMKDIISDFHIHSTHSDGHNTIEEIAEYYIKSGLKTIAITDHGKGLHITKIKDMDKYFEDIENVQKKFPQIRILKGIEANIDKEGNLDYTDDELTKFDVVVAAIHFSMELQEREQTDRIIKAIRNKHVKILGHITCEDYGVRKPISVNWLEIFDECVKNNVAIEINAQPSRIFFSNEVIQMAKQKGVKFTFGSDMHAIPQGLTLALWRAQRGGLTKDDFIQNF